jgi:hypothetical protein
LCLRATDAAASYSSVVEKLQKGAQELGYQRLGLPLPAFRWDDKEEDAKACVIVESKLPVTAPLEIEDIPLARVAARHCNGQLDICLRELRVWISRQGLRETEIPAMLELSLLASDKGAPAASDLEGWLRRAVTTFWPLQVDLPARDDEGLSYLRSINGVKRPLLQGDKVAEPPAAEIVKEDHPAPQSVLLYVTVEPAPADPGSGSR